MTGPLSGVTVVDLTRLVAGDYCTSLLVALGAEVVKIEDPTRGDYIGEFGGVVNDVPVAHHLFNRGKRSVCIDLKRAEGQAALRRLVARADLLVESFRPGVMARLGLEPEGTMAQHPGLVWVAISAYGAESPRSHVPGHDINYLAEAGLLDRLTGTDGRPVPPPIPLADLIGGGLIPALTAVSMLLQARLTGRGGYIDASITDGTALLPSVLLADLVAGAPAVSGGRALLTGEYACYDVYRLIDGYAAVGALEATFWEQLCLSIGHPEIVQLQWDPAAQTRARTVLSEAFASLTKEDVAGRGLDQNACVSVVRSYEEALRAEDAVDRGTAVVANGGFLAPALSFRIDGRQLSPAPSAPQRGEDTREVLESLGMSEAEISALFSNGTVREPEAGPS